MKGKEGKKMVCWGAKKVSRGNGRWKRRGVTEKLHREKDGHCPLLSN